MPVSPAWGLHIVEAVLIQFTNTWICVHSGKLHFLSLSFFNQRVLGPGCPISWDTAARPPQLVVRDENSLQGELKLKMKFTLFMLWVTLHGCVHSIMTAALFLQFSFFFSQLEKSKKKLQYLHLWRKKEKEEKKWWQKCSKFSLG